MSERGEFIECPCGYMRYSNEPCDICAQIEKAYKRGREDAADEILKAGYQRSLNLIEAVTIARGGEQG